MKRTWLFSPIFVIFLSVLTLHCNLLDDDKETISVESALAVSTCGPTDGPAFNVFISEQAASCSALDELMRTNPPPESVLRFSFFGRESPILPSTILLEDAAALVSDGGVAERCPTFAACQYALQGTVRFGPTSDGRIEMSYDIRFDNGTREQAVVLVRWCEPRQPLLCG